VRDNYLKNINLLICLLISLSLSLVTLSKSWGKTESSTKRISIIYSANTSGYIKPTG